MRDVATNSADLAPGAASLASGDFAAAIRECDAALLRNPESADAYSNRARARGASGDLDGAIADAIAAIGINPKHAWAYRTLGDIHVAQRNLKAAIACCDQAIRLDPFLAEAYNTRAGARILGKEFAAALPDCNQAIRLAPHLWGAYITRGNARYHLYDPNAVEDLRKSFQLCPVGFTTNIVRLIASQLKHELDYMFANCAEHLRANPQDVMSYTRRGLALLLLGRDDEAQRDLDQVLILQPLSKARIGSLIAEVKRVRGRARTAKP